MKKRDEIPLVISELTVGVQDKEILHGVSLTVRRGEVHAIMGPNGSGKSTLSYALMGHPTYEIRGKKSFAGLGKLNLLRLPAEERAKHGLFLAFQSPIAIPGVSILNLLRTSFEEIYKDDSAGGAASQNPVLSRRWHAAGMTLPEFMKNLKEVAAFLHIDETFLTRGIHDGFSGGEKKKIEMLEALMLSPKFAIFDEIDTGLDVDALKIVAKGIEKLKQGGTGVIVITHYQRILQHLRPDVVHVFVNGNIVKTGTYRLAATIEKEGYKRYLS